MKNPITIIKVKVDNFLRLTAARVEIDPEGGLIRVTGQNKAGKTSLLRSIAASIGGGKEVPDDPLHEDSESGAITLELSNGFTIERRFTSTESGMKGYLKAVGPNGEEMKQTALNDWLGPRSFDPLHFFSLHPNDQRDVLLGLDPEVAAELVAMDEKSESLKSERLPYNSTIQKIQRMKTPDGLRPEKVDVTAEMERLKELEEQQSAHDSLAEQLSNIKDKIDEYDANINLLKSQLEVQETLLKDAKKTRVQIQEDVAKHRPVTIDIEQLKEKISGADEINAELAPWEEWDRGQEELKEASETSQTFTDQIDAIEIDKKELLQGLSIGVEGLGFDESGNPTLNGHPMEQASGRERVEVAVAVAMAYDPQLRICLVDEANDLDADGLKALDKKARDHGFQVWACRIDEGNPGEVVVEDGVAVTEGD